MLFFLLIQGTNVTSFLVVFFLFFYLKGSDTCTTSAQLQGTLEWDPHMFTPTHGGDLRATLRGGASQGWQPP
jgi:hypothetical protein